MLLPTSKLPWMAVGQVGTEGQDQELGKTHEAQWVVGRSGFRQTTGQIM